MSVFVAGLLLFLGIHSIGIAAPSWRTTQIARMGEGAWKGIYSLAATIGLGLLIYGFGRARQQPLVLFAVPGELHWITIGLMAPVFPLLFAAYLPGRISAAIHHPMLFGILFWSAAHAMGCGTLQDVLLFGSFLLWAAADLAFHIRNRPPRHLARAPARRANDAIAVILGLGVYALFLLKAHQWLIGISPLG